MNLQKRNINELDFLNKKIEDKKVFISNDLENNKDKKHVLVIKKSKSSEVLEESRKIFNFFQFQYWDGFFEEE